MNDEPRNFLDEAIRIIKGQSMLLPQIEHLQALNDSRIYWRAAFLGQQGRTTDTQRRAS